MPIWALALNIQSLKKCVGSLTHTANQQVAALEPVIDKVVHQLEILDLAGTAHMDPGAGAFLQLAADADMVLVPCVNRWLSVPPPIEP